MLKKTNFPLFAQCVCARTFQERKISARNQSGRQRQKPFVGRKKSFRAHLIANPSLLSPLRAPLCICKQAPEGNRNGVAGWIENGHLILRNLWQVITPGSWWKFILKKGIARVTTTVTCEFYFKSATPAPFFLLLSYDLVPPHLIWSGESRKQPRWRFCLRNRWLVLSLSLSPLCATGHCQKTFSRARRQMRISNLSVAPIANIFSAHQLAPEIQ